MKIIPAIDLQNGEAVRLYKGDYDKKRSIQKIHLKLLKNLKEWERLTCIWLI